MDAITDEYMKEMLTKSKFYSLLVLKAGPKEITPEQIFLSQRGFPPTNLLN